MQPAFPALVGAHLPHAAIRLIGSISLWHAICVGMGLIACGSSGSPSPSQPPPADEPISEFSVTILSRGRGVPEEARVAFVEVKRQLELESEDDVSFSEYRIGIEGERRLCIRATSEQAEARLYEEFEKLVHGVDLIRLERAPCPESTRSNRPGP